MSFMDREVSYSYIIRSLPHFPDSKRRGHPGVADTAQWACIPYPGRGGSRR